MNKNTDVSELVGLTLTTVATDSNEIIFISSCGRTFEMLHLQDCCESVWIEEISGDLQDLVGSPILLAEESTSEKRDRYGGGDGCTWTFYKLATAKGYVDIRWCGESNGYYSESVDFQEVISEK